jgi:eukaryotic-like serine/threonine-protein kinase
VFAGLSCDNGQEQMENERWAAIEALAKTLGVEAACGHTYRPEELLARMASGGLSEPRSTSTEPGAMEDTGVVFERMLRRQEGDARLRPGDDFRLIEIIGEGGMGVIYRAEQASLHREVAIKRVRGGLDPQAEQYFLSEATITAKLEHANIVPVHVLARADDGAPMLAMKLVKGTSWRDLLHGEGGKEIDLAGHLRVLLSVCNAIAFAHRQGFIHRDLKPENVMVGEFGQVFVMDWGIAVGLDRAACDASAVLHVADARSPAGTPGYMAPELARGEGEAQGERTDVYLLGACLHELITRAPRHTGTTVRDVLDHAVASAPFAYDSAVPRELAAISNRATASDPADRFPSVEALRDAIEAFLEHSAARSVTEKGLAALAQLEGEIASYSTATESERGARSHAIHRSHAEARFAFEHAIGIGDFGGEALKGLHAASKLLLQHAIATEDTGLADRLLADHDEPTARAEVEAVRARVAARAVELEALRETARRLDWSAIARPLGSVFLAAGILGGAGALVTRVLLRDPETRSVPMLGLLWGSLAVVSGLYALVKLRSGRATGSLLSPRVVGSWAVVAMGCFANGITAYQRHRAPFEDAHNSTTMIAIGFAVMALQTRLWLLVPAAAFFAGAVYMGAYPQHSVGIFGALWFLSLSGVGVAFKMGARIDARG